MSLRSVPCQYVRSIFYSHNAQRLWLDGFFYFFIYLWTFILEKQSAWLGIEMPKPWQTRKLQHRTKT